MLTLNNSNNNGFETKNKIHITNNLCSISNPCLGLLSTLTNHQIPPLTYGFSKSDVLETHRMVTNIN